ncbi:MAG TPA: hypothetical protein VIH91_05835, partial [Terriglobales bacterium]
MTTNSARVGARLFRLSHTVGVIALAVVLASVGCSKKAPATAATEQPSPAATSDASPSGWTLDLTVTPDHPRMVRPATVAVHIADSAGKPVDNALVT